MNYKGDLTLDETIDAGAREEKARALLIQNPLNRPALYAILKACSKEVWFLDDLEAYIQSLAEFENATQPPYFLIQWLVEAFALDTWEVDAHGEKITPERTEGLTEDEIDDLAVATAFQISETGKTILAEFSPKSRLMDLLEIRPARFDAYLEVLEFVQEKRTLSEIDKLLRGTPILMDGRPEGENPMQPSVFVDKLAAAGGILYQEGWIITEEGKELLDTIKASQNQGH